MSRKARSARGEIVDFNLIEVKKQIANRPAPINVQEREEFIEQKTKKRTRKRVDSEKLKQKHVDERSQLNDQVVEQKQSQQEQTDDSTNKQEQTSSGETKTTKSRQVKKKTQQNKDETGDQDE